MISITTCSAGSARCREWSTSLRASVFPGATSRHWASASPSRSTARPARTVRTTCARGSVPYPPDSSEPWECRFCKGRDFRDTDRDGSERVVIVSQSVAQKLFPGQDALNRELRWTDGVMKFIGISYEPRRIIGVVPDFDDENIIPSPAMTVYQPTDQEGWQGRLFVRAKQDPYTLVPVHHPHHSRHGGRPAGGACQHACRTFAPKF